MHPRDYVEIDYTNYRGERGKRVVRVFQFYFGSNEWHTEPQWLFRAYCVKSGEGRDFAMAGLHGWKPVETPAAAL